MNKKIKITALSTAMAVVLGLSFNVAAGGETEPVLTDLINKTISAGKTSLYENAPDWLSRTSIELQIEENYKPTIELETVQPIMQHNSKNDMVFYQLNARTRNSKKSYNMGLGYRNIFSEDMMYGVNIFYDYSAENEHKRSGFGLEAISNDYEARANSYNTLSNRKEIRTDEFEEALDGWDVEVGGSIIPFDKNLKIYLSHSEFDTVTDGVNDYKDNRIRAIYPVTSNIILEVGRTMEKEKYGKNDKERSFAKLKYTFGNQEGAWHKPKNLRTRLLQPVERRHEIVLEKTINATVSVGRGT